MSIIGECRNNKECVIDKKNRTSCKACRLQKCLLVGMSKSGSRYGRRSNWFKQYFQENEERRATVCGKRAIKMMNEYESELIKQSHATTNPSFNSSTTTLRSHSPKNAPSADLLQSSISSHLEYFNCFNRLSLNRLISYRHDSKFLLPNTVIPFTSILNNDVNVNDYFEKLLTRRYESRDIADELRQSEDPLDLSQKRDDECRYDTNTKKTVPLDLSVK